MILISLICVLWLMSCAVCVLVGFFVAKNRKSRKAVKPIDSSEQKRLEREQQELLNMLTYDGTPQIEVRGKR